MVRSHVSTVVGVLAGILLISSATADSDAERGALARLIRELDALEPLIDAAERHADRYTRARFAYDWLRGDLERMKAGIRAHLERPRTEPNENAPVVGEDLR
jgi:RAQPRD family integrative conjugative element protein